MSYTALYRKFRPDEFEDVKGQDAIVTDIEESDRMRIVSDMHICSAEPEEPERQPLRRYLRKQSTVNIR